MKLIGRLLLIGAGVWICIFQVPAAIEYVKEIMEIGIPGIVEHMSLILDALKCLGYLVAALVAFIGALRGKKGFFLAVAAIALMIEPVLSVVHSFQNGSFQQDILDILKVSGQAILYFLGFLFV